MASISADRLPSEIDFVYLNKIAKGYYISQGGSLDKFSTS